MKFFLLLALLGPLAVAQPAAPTVWRLDDLATVGGHSAKKIGSPRLARDAAGAAIFFDGAHDGLVVPANPLRHLRAFTIELLIRPDADGPAEQRFFHVQDADTHRALLELRLRPDGRWALDTFLRCGDSSLPLLDLAKLHSSAAWHWVALRYDGRRMTSFVDGVEELAGDVTFLSTAAGETSLGVRLNLVLWFKGAIREIRVSPAALAPAQLAH